MNYSQALSFIFEDQKWVKKLVIGGIFAFLSFLCGLVFIFGFFLIGYYLSVIRNVMNDKKSPLPEWSQVNKILVDGILGAIVAFIYFVVIGGVCALVIIHFASHPYMTEAEAACGIVFTSLLTVFALFFFINFGLLQFAATENFASAFDISAMVTLIKSHFADLFAITIFSLILHAILLCVGIVIFSPFTNFWGLLVQAHLFGQCLRRFQTASPALEST